MQSDVLFIGLGNMGLSMALNLAKAGLRVAGHDLAQARVDEFVQGGGLAVADLRHAAERARVVITMLPASRHVEACYLGAGASAATDGLLAQVSPGCLLIDCSTIAPEAARQVAAAAARRGLSMIDAPVSGGTAGAAAGTLTFMAGGAAADVQRARPYLEKMGKSIFHAGHSGAGQAAKICNNLLLGILMIGTSEAIRLGQANGLDAAVLSEIMSRSSGRNWALELYNPCPGVMPAAPASHGYRGGFAVDLMLKDLGLATESAAATGLPAPLGALARSLYQRHSESGAGALDFSSIFQMPEV